MKNKIVLIAILIFVNTIVFAQKKEKIKGSKIITLTVKEIDSFDTIDIADNLDVFLVKSDKNSIEIEADDNLHDAIIYEIVGSTLKFYTTKDVISAKKFSVRINYTNELKLVVLKNEAKLNALADLQLDNITIKNFDNSKSFLNVKSTDFTLILNDKAIAELNIKAQKTTLELSSSSELKALITSPELKIDMYQKTKAEIEGETKTAFIRLDNNAKLIAKNLAINEMTIATEMNSYCQINIKDKLIIAASGNSEIEFLGDAKVELTVFKNNARLQKIEKY
jgi:hypothetical protein